MNKNVFYHVLKVRDFLVDLLFPIICLGCGQGEKYLCEKCKKKIIINKKFSCPECKLNNILNIVQVNQQCKA